MRYLFENRDDDKNLPGRERRIATLCLLVFAGMATLDTSFVTIALPTITRDLRISESQSVWIVSAYQLAAAVSILTFSALSSMLGFRRLFITGVLVFTVASLGCTLSTSFLVLLVLRFLQGLGAATSTCVMATLFHLVFPSRLLGSALGVNALTVTNMIAIGPTLNNTIVSAFAWPWLFAINVPLGALTVCFVWGVLPPEHARAQTFNIINTVTSTLEIGCLLLTVYTLKQPNKLHAAALFLAGAALLTLVFVHVQRTATAPLLRLDIFTDEQVTLATATSIITNIKQNIALVALPFLFQSRYGVEPVASELLFTPMPIAIMLAAPLSGRLADHYDSTPLTTENLAATALGYAILGTLDPVSISIYQIAIGMFVCGFGFGLFQTPNNREFISNIDHARLGNASGLLTFSHSVGLTIDTVIAGLVALITTTPNIVDPARLPAPHHVSLWLAATATMLTTIISALRLRTL